MSNVSILQLRPGDLASGRPYIERDEREPPIHDRIALALWHGVLRPLARPLGVHRRSARAFVARVNAQAAELGAADDAALREQARVLRRRLRGEGFALEPVAQTFALAREAASRVIGQRHYDTQVLAGWWLLQGTLVEMATGEGKTFAATLPALTAALAGVATHVITVNDYLAARDAQSMGPLYQFFGLRAGAVVHGMPPAERRAVYAGDITYASNKELAFDYLRDRAALGDRASTLHLAADSVLETRGDGRSGATVLRGLMYGIVDEADSVFIDEARTPLILSQMTDEGTLREPYERALSIAAALDEGIHFELEYSARRVRMTDAGRDAADALDEESGESPFVSARARQEAVQRALAARHFYERDRQYVVVEGKVQIVDEATGRAMPDRAWERGLHQMIEAKEGLAVTGARETRARITYQRLFRRYLRLAGMSGTAAEVAAEIGRTYGPAVVRVPLHRPSRRVLLAPRCLHNAAEKWQVVAGRIEQVAGREQRPVLVGTRTVEASEQLSALLGERGVEHVVLNAKQDREEAAIVARAGEAGRVTVATNMAGRGTDIVLGPGVAERGGLHVILTEFHESPRIDRQLFGRCGRQGDPGSGEAIVALDDELFTSHAPWLVRTLRRRGGDIAAHQLWLLRRVAQAVAGRRNRDAREGSLRQDRRFAQVLAFAGRGE
jgi:preprotein translocase subunit SecA